MSSFADSRWRVLPIGRAATLLRAAVEAVTFALCGLVGLFAAAVLGGVLIEEVFAGTAAGTTIDLVARASLVGDLVLGVLGLLVLGLLGSLRGPLMARALAAEMRRGTPATSVPIPTQWEAARESSAGAYKVIAVVLLALLGLFSLIGIFALVEGGLDRVGLAILGGGALLLTTIWAGIPLTGRVFTRWQSRCSEELPQRWTQPHRIIAAGRELTEEDITAQRAAAEERGPGHGKRAAPPLPGRGVRMLCSALVTIVVLAAMAAMTLFQIVVAVAYPEATRHAGRQLGERADLAPEDEQLVDLLAMGMGIAGVVGALALAGIVVCTIILRRLEHRVLRRALADPAAVPPSYVLLSRAMAPTSLPLLKVLFAFSGAGAALGIALWFVDAVAELPDWDHYAAAGPELRAAGALGPWIVLGALAVLVLGVLVSSVLDARDQRLRDALVQRWPVRPVEEKVEVKDEGGGGSGTSETVGT